MRAVLETPNPTGKYARWWTRVYGSGVKEVKILHRSGKTNVGADALSRNPHLPPPREGIGQSDVQVFSVGTVDLDVNTLLDSASDTRQALRIVSFAEEQRKDPRLVELIQFLEHGKLPEQETRASKISLQSPLFTLVDSMLFFIDPKSEGGCPRTSSGQDHGGESPRADGCSLFGE